MAEFKVASAYADFEVKVDEGIDKAKARIRERQSDLDASAKIKLDVDTKDAKARIREDFKDERFSIKADADTTLARAKIDKLADGRTVTVKVDVDESALGKTRKTVDDETSKMASRANSQFSAMLYGALTVGLPAAAAAGSALTVAALAAVPIAFGGMIVGLTKGTDEVSSKWATFSDGVLGDAKAMAQQYTGPVVGAIDDMGSAWVRLRPKVDVAMNAAAPQIREVVGAATDLAENAMPGVITAMERSDVAISAVRTVAGQTGQGLSEFFANASRGAQGSAQGLVIFGGTVQTVLSRAGELAANLGNLSAGPLRSLDTIVNQVTGTLVTLTSQGSGAIGFLQGFGTAGSGLVSVLGLVASAVSLIPPQVTQLGGSFTATAMLAGKFGVDVGAGFDGIGKKIGEAEGARAKFSAGMVGLAEGVFNPATVAVGVLSIGLDLLGHEQEVAAQYAAQHRDTVRELTQAIREDNGALGENVNKANIKALADKNATANLATFGSTLGDAKLAIEGNTDAYDRLNYSARAQMDTIGKNLQLSEQDRNSLKDLATQSLQTGKGYEQMSMLGNQATSMMDSFGGAAHDQMNALLNATGAVGEQINAQKQAQQAYLDSEHALTGLSEAQIKARDSTVEHTKATMDGIGGELGYRGAVEATKQAMDTLTKTNQNHKSTEDQKAQAMLGAEQAMYRQIQAAGAAAAANSNLTTESQRAAASTTAMNRETVNLANSWQGTLPASLQAGISKMTVAEAQAGGLTIAIDNTGQAVYRLPNGKTIDIESSAERERAKVDALNQSIGALRDRNISITTTYFYGTVGAGNIPTGAYVARAQGGLVGRLATASGSQYAEGITSVRPSMANVIGNAFTQSIRDTVPALLAEGETVTNARQTARNYRELVAINSGQRNYEKWPDTGRPPQPQVPAQRSAPSIDMGGVTIVGADPDEVLTKITNRLSWAVRR